MDYPKSGNILPIQLGDEFILSTEDKRSIPPHLSVWVESLTTPEQAYSFLQENTPNSPRRLILRLKVDAIRRIVASLGENNTYANLLNVVWVYRLIDFNGRLIKDRRPGAKGHSGITGMDENSAPEGLSPKQSKLLRKILRSQLAELASKDHRLLGEE